MRDEKEREKMYQHSRHVLQQPRLAIVIGQSSIVKLVSRLKRVSDHALKMKIEESKFDQSGRGEILVTLLPIGQMHTSDTSFIYLPMNLH